MLKALYFLIGNAFFPYLLGMVDGVLFGDHENSFAKLLYPNNYILSPVLVYLFGIILAYFAFYRNGRIPGVLKWAKANLLFVFSSAVFQILFFIMLNAKYYIPKHIGLYLMVVWLFLFIASLVVCFIYRTYDSKKDH